MSSKGTCELALCCNISDYNFMICHPRLKFTLFLSYVIKWEEELWAKLFKAAICISTALRLAKNTGAVVAPAHITQPCSNCCRIPISHKGLYWQPQKARL